MSYIFFHPDCTVGSGITPDQLFKARGLEAKRFLPPVGNLTPPKTLIFFNIIHSGNCFVNISETNINANISSYYWNRLTPTGNRRKAA